jgi:hypothetical protein
MILLQAQRLHVGGELSAPPELKQAANRGGASERSNEKAIRETEGA